MAIDDTLFNALLKQERKPPPSRYKVYDQPENTNEDNKELNKRQNRDKLNANIKTNKRQNRDVKIQPVINRDKIETKLETVTETEQRQNSKKIETNINFESIVRNERKILVLIYDLCKSELNQATPPLTIEHIAESSQINKASIKKSIQRLEKKGAIIRYRFKKGPGGWTQYALPKTLYDTILYYENNNKLETFQRQNRVNIKTNMETLTETKTSSSSSHNLNTTTTDQNVLPPEWEEINLNELAKRNIRFNKQHLHQVYPTLKSKYQSYEFQESIDAFVYDLDNKHVTIRISSVGMLLKIFRAGELYISEYYVSPETKLLLENAERSKQRKYQQEEAKFLLWLESPETKEIIKKELSPNLWIDFEHGGRDSMEHIKTNIYSKANNRV